jgi:LAO/AO transport system kinase
VTPAELALGVASGDRTAIGRAITLVESTRTDDQVAAAELLAALPTRSALRVGITGAPGAGKSTFLEAIGMQLIESGARVGVLAIDPSSRRTHGSILGDKTRMHALSRDERAFVRPTASGGHLGGVAPATREGVRVLEAAGYDVVFVETVGVGQSEVDASCVVDTLVWVTGPSSGDELQGIKRGLVESVDVVVVNKCDGERVVAAQRTKAEVEAALRYVPAGTPGWDVPVVLASAIERSGIDASVAAIRAHRAHLESRSLLVPRREAQSVEAFRRALERALVASIGERPELRAIEADVAAGRCTIHAALARALALR